jgi:FkbM family methyltransferase
MILVGMGELGKNSLAAIRSRGVEPQAVADNNSSLWGTSIDDCTVLMPYDAVTVFPDTEFVVTVFQGASVVKQLRDLGAKNILTYPQFCRKYLGGGQDVAGCWMPSEVWYAERSEKFDALSGVVKDNISRNEVWGQFHWRMTLSDNFLPSPLPISELYFPGFLERNPQEVFVDCGAFDGDSIRRFQAWAGAYHSIFAFEPVNSVNTDAHVLPYAVGNEDGFVTFKEEGSASRKEEGSRRRVRMVRLDTWFGQAEMPIPTFIKMDVEGAELGALRGASDMIRRHAPVLAVCLYHEPQHLWEIPFLIHELQPDYDLFIRRYAEECWELVCYAVPKDRVKR